MLIKNKEFSERNAIILRLEIDCGIGYNKPKSWEAIKEWVSDSESWPHEDNHREIPYGMRDVK